MNEYNKALDIAVENHQLKTKIVEMQRSFCQTVLAIVTAMPDDAALDCPVVRISPYDYQRTVGRELVTYRDPATGDQVFVSRPLLEERESQP
jgi:hypothetical protein